MRIGIDARMFSSNFTGIGRYVFELISHLAPLAPNDEFVLFLNEPEFSEFTPPWKNVRKVLANARHYSLAEQTRFLQILNRENLDLMHFTHFNAPIFYLRPSVVTIHDLTLSFFPGKKMRRWFHRLGYSVTIRAAVFKARHIIAVSNHTKDDLMRLLGTSPEKITVTYEAPDAHFRPIDDAEKTAIKKKYDLKRFLLYTGVWREHKNVAGMIEAFAKIAPQFPDLDLVITGRADPAYPEVLETIEKHGLGDRVKRVGLVPEADLWSLVGAATAYIFPSFYEGFGLPPLEAMAAGAPVAASNASCIPEICGEGNALFFDPRDRDEMAAAIEKIVSNDDLRETLRKRGIAHAASFSWQKMAEETLEVYRNAVRNVQ